MLQANPTFTDLLGWSIEELKGLTLPPSLHNMTKEQHDAFLNKLRDGENVNYSLTKEDAKMGKSWISEQPTAPLTRVRFLL
ncbi:PAS domain S-box protein [Bacillus sp. OV166]|uniref:PAS domain S-box protein n=1 Tax=Bacillus sp. OV166 TaxID=1882763 RepID=UPI00358E4C29